MENFEYLSELKIEVQLLKKDITFITTLFDKMDKLISKIENQHESIIEKTNSIIDTKTKLTKEELTDLCRTLEKTEIVINNRINSIENILLSEIKEANQILTDKIKSINTTLIDHIEDEDSLVNKFNRIVYLGSGAIIVLLWILNNLDTVKKLFN